MGGCYEPSTLISWVHEQVPFVDPGFNNSGETAEDLVDNLNHGVASFYDYFLRAAVWGGVVFLVAVPLPVLSCVWYCCTIKACRRSRERESGPRRHTLTKAVCLVLLIGLVLANVSFIGVGLWAEEQLDREFKNNLDEIRSLLENASSLSSQTGNNSSSGNSLDSFSSFKSASEWVLLVCFVALFIPLLAVLFGLIVASICKHPSAMIIALILLMFTTVTLVPCIGVGVFLLILYSDVCVGLQYKQLNVTEGCIPQLQSYTDNLESFCTNAYVSFLMMVLAAAGIVLAHCCLQLSGSCFAGLYTGYRRSVRIAPFDDNTHEMQPPSPPPNSPLPPDTDEADTAALLLSMDQEPASTVESEENWPQDPLPSAPPLNTPDPPQYEQPSIIEYQDNPVTV